MRHVHHLNENLSYKNGIMPFWVDQVVVHDDTSFTITGKDSAGKRIAPTRIRMHEPSYVPRSGDAVVVNMQSGYIRNIVGKMIIPEDSSKLDINPGDYVINASSSARINASDLQMQNVSILKSSSDSGGSNLLTDNLSLDANDFTINNGSSNSTTYSDGGRTGGCLLSTIDTIDDQISYASNNLFMINPGLHVFSCYIKTDDWHEDNNPILNIDAYSQDASTFSLGTSEWNYQVDLSTSASAVGHIIENDTWTRVYVTIELPPYPVSFNSSTHLWVGEWSIIINGSSYGLTNDASLSDWIVDGTIEYVDDNSYDFTKSSRVWSRGVSEVSSYLTLETSFITSGDYCNIYTDFTDDQNWSMVQLKSDGYTIINCIDGVRSHSTLGTWSLITSTSYRFNLKISTSTTSISIYRVSDDTLVTSASISGTSLGRVGVSAEQCDLLIDNLKVLHYQELSICDAQLELGESPTGYSIHTARTSHPSLSSLLDITPALTGSLYMKRLLYQAHGFKFSSTGVGTTYILGSDSSTTVPSPLSSGTTMYTIPLLRIDDADYAIAGRTLKMTLDCSLSLNSVAPGVNITFSILPVTAVAGAANSMTFTYGTALATTTFTTPAANQHTSSSTTINFPADGIYVIGVAFSNNQTVGSMCSFGARVYTHWT